MKYIEELITYKKDIDAIQIAEILWLSQFMSSESSEVEEKPKSTSDIDDTEIEEPIEEDLPSSEDEVPEPIDESTPIHEDKKQKYGFDKEQDNGSSYATNIVKKEKFPKIEKQFQSLKVKQNRISKQVLDEVKTADYIATTGYFHPIFSEIKSKESYFSLHIIIDKSESMFLWESYTNHFIKSMKFSTIFTHIHIFELDSSQKEPSVSAINSDHSINLDSAIFREEKSITLVFSDITGNSWKSNEMFKILGRWSKGSFVTIVSMLPKRMWKKTPLRQGISLFMKPKKFLPKNKDLKAEFNFTGIKTAEKGINIPMLTFDSYSFSHLSNVLMSKKDSWVDSRIFRNLVIKEVAKSKKTNISPKERVANFFSFALPKTRELAIYCSVLPLNQEIIREVIEKRDLGAEKDVFLEFYFGGLIDKDVEATFGEYAFYEGVAKELRQYISVQEMEILLHQVSEVMSSSFGIDTTKINLLYESVDGSEELNDNERALVELMIEVLEDKGRFYEDNVVSLEKLISKNDSTFSEKPNRKTSIVQIETSRGHGIGALINYNNEDGYTTVITTKHLLYNDVGELLEATINNENTFYNIDLNKVNSVESVDLAIFKIRHQSSYDLLNIEEKESKIGTMVSILTYNNGREYVYNGEITKTQYHSINSYAIAIKIIDFVVNISLLSGSPVIDVNTNKIIGIVSMLDTRNNIIKAISTTELFNQQEREIILYKENDLDIDLVQIVAYLNKICNYLIFKVGKVPFTLDENIVSASKSYQNLNSLLYSESENSLRAILFTEKSYDNDYFFEPNDNYTNLRIVSFNGWSTLTTLSKNNGTVYFIGWIVALISDSFSRHYDERTGCIYDFSETKTDIDKNMREPYICQSCFDVISQKESFFNSEILDDLNSILNFVGRSSKNDLDICAKGNEIEESVVVQLEKSGWDKSNIIQEYKLPDRHRVDLLLEYEEKPLAVIEVKSITNEAKAGLKQAIFYGKQLNIDYVYSTNGLEIYEYSLKNEIGKYINEYPSPEELYQRYNKEATKDILNKDTITFYCDECSSKYNIDCDSLEWEQEEDYFDIYEYDSTYTEIVTHYAIYNEDCNNCNNNMNITFISNEEYPLGIEKSRDIELNGVKDLEENCHLEYTSIYREPEDIPHSNFLYEKDMKRMEHEKLISEYENKNIITLKKTSYKVPSQLTLKLGKDNIIGREKELKEIDTLLKESSPILLINGIGGIGKSTIVNYYLHTQKDKLDYYGFFEGLESFTSELREPLSLQQEKESDAFIEAISKLRELKGNKLLVFDDIRDIEENREKIEKILALKNSGYKILLTSREEIEDINQYYLNTLSLEDAKVLFNSIYQVEDEALLGEVLTYLDGNSFFIEMTAKALKSKKTLTLETIKDKFKNGEFSIIKSKRKESFSDYLNQLFTFDELDNEEIIILKQLSILPSIEIEFRFLEQIFNKQNNKEFEEILNYLSEKGWLKNIDNKYKLHQTIKEYILSNHLPSFDEIENIVDFFYNSKAKDLKNNLFYIESINHILRQMGKKDEFYNNSNISDTLCDLCKIKLNDEDFFVDGKIKNSGGKWGNVCLDCFEKYGIQIGKGIGQLYKKDDIDKWLLLAGWEMNITEDRKIINNLRRYIQQNNRS